MRVWLFSENLNSNCAQLKTLECLPKPRKTNPKCFGNKGNRWWILKRLFCKFNKFQNARSRLEERAWTFTNGYINDNSLMSANDYEFFGTIPKVATTTKVFESSFNISQIFERCKFWMTALLLWFSYKNILSSKIYTRSGNPL